MRYCPNCGRKNTDDALFCLECGARLPELSGYEQPEPETPGQTEPFGQAGETLPYDQNPQPGFGPAQPYEPSEPAQQPYYPPEPPQQPYYPPVAPPVTPPPQPPVYGPNGIPGQQPFGPNGVPGQPPQPAPPKKSGGGKTAVIVALALVIALLAGGIVGFLIWRAQTKTDGDATTSAAPAAATTTAPADGTTATTAAPSTAPTTAPPVIVDVPQTQPTTQPTHIPFETAQRDFCAFYQSYISAMNAQVKSGITNCSGDVANAMYARMDLNSRSTFRLEYVDFDMNTVTALSGGRVQFVARCHSLIYNRANGAYKEAVNAIWTVVSTYDAANGGFLVTSINRNDGIRVSSNYERRMTS